jgi:hypothetical protein
MAIIKLNNRAVKDATAVGSTTQLGNLVFISKQTASSSASVSFTSGINSTYKEYIFYFNNIHPQSDNQELFFNFSIDAGSNYNVTKTTSTFQAYHNEAGSDSSLSYHTAGDLAQSTNYQRLGFSSDNADDASLSGYLHLFEPSSDTFVKHFIATTNMCHADTYSVNYYLAGYCNTTSAVNAIRFAFGSGNIDAGTISLYGVA